MDNPFVEILKVNKVDKKVEKKSISLQQGAVAFGLIAATGMSIGAALGTYIFFGTVTLVGLVVVIESNPVAKKIVKKSNRLVDATILVASIYAIGTLGVTVAASLTFCGLGYTLLYAPYIRQQDNV